MVLFGLWQSTQCVPEHNFVWVDIAGVPQAMVPAADKGPDYAKRMAMPPRGTPMFQSTAECPVDLEDGLARAGDDRDFYRELLQMFVDDAPLRIEELMAAIDAHDATRICSVAHGMKGAAANLSANAVRDCAHQLETLARQGAIQGYESPFARLRKELRRLAEFVREF